MTVSHTRALKALTISHPVSVLSKPVPRVPRDRPAPCSSLRFFYQQQTFLIPGVAPKFREGLNSCAGTNTMSWWMCRDVYWNGEKISDLIEITNSKSKIFKIKKVIFQNVSQLFCIFAKKHRNSNTLTFGRRALHNYNRFWFYSTFSFCSAKHWPSSAEPLRDSPSDSGWGSVEPFVFLQQINN